MTRAMLTRTNVELLKIKRNLPTINDTKTSKQEPAWVRRVSLQVLD